MAVMASNAKNQRASAMYACSARVPLVLPVALARGKRIVVDVVADDVTMPFACVAPIITKDSKS